MKRFFGLGAAAVAGIALTVLLSNIGGSPAPVSAVGFGGTISFGTVSGATVPVNTTATTDPYSGFSIHVGTNLSPGVGLTSITGDRTGSVLTDPLVYPNDLFCTSSAPAAGEGVVACAGLASQSITTAGLLLTLTFNATGDGCIVATLLTGVDALLNTYTTNADDSSQQSVTLGPAVNILIGTGVIGDCGTAAPTPTGTATATAIPTNTPAPTATPTPCPPIGCPPTMTPAPPIKGTLTPTGTPPTATPTASATDTPAPAPPVGVTAPGNAAGAGAARTGIHLPDTGDGSGAGGSTAIWLAVSIAAAMLGASAVVLSRRRV